jgi:23S rRNA (cytosine1962-C5)-methyltransferase
MTTPELIILTSPDWTDYELLDSGSGMKLERFGAYRFVRPEHQAVWRRSLPPVAWEKADAIFKTTREESGGYWEYNRKIHPIWEMRYKGLTFNAATSNSRHLGVFPEQASHWEWFSQLIRNENRQVKVLNLFGYTGLATLAAAQAGAVVTHVDASKKSIAWAKQNQALSKLEHRPIRWLVDDAVKFVQREIRRGSKYDGILLDPPKFGRGPSGQVWEFFDQLPELLSDCRQILSQDPLFVVLTAYAIRASALCTYYALEEMVAGLNGSLETGELALNETSAGHILPAAIYARWCAKSNS